jgi:hypothetical protein
MAGLKSIELEVEGAKDLALIDSQDGVWLVVPIRWWDFATLIWWLLCPSDRKANIHLRLTNEQKINAKAVRVATRHVRVRGLAR